MQSSKQRVLSIIAVSALAFGLAACNKTEDTSAQTPGQKMDQAISQSEQAAKDAAAKVEQGASQMGDAAKGAMNSASAAIDEAGITAKVKAGLVKDSELSALQINVDTKGNAVTLQGEAPTAAAKQRAEDIAKAVEGVGMVNNMLTVKGG